MPFVAEKVGDFCTGCGRPIVPGDRVAGGPFPRPFFHIGCWPKESQAPRSDSNPQDQPTIGNRDSRYELELSTKRDPAPERRVVKVICPRGTSATGQAKLMQWLGEVLRMNDPLAQ